MQADLVKVTPVSVKRIQTQTIKPWVDEEGIIVRKRHRKLKRKMLNDRDSISIDNYRNQINRVNDLIEQNKRRRFSNHQ